MTGCLLLVCASAQAAVHVQAETLSMPGVQLADVSMQVSMAADGRPQIVLEAGEVSAPSLGWRGVALKLHGVPQPATRGGWRFAGHVETRHAPGGALADADLTILYDPGAATLEVVVTQGRSRLHAMMPMDQTTHVQLSLAALPLTWLRGVLASAWPEGRLAGGHVAGNVALDLAAGGTRVSGRVQVSNVNLDSRSGTMAVQKLDASGSFRIDAGAAKTGVMFDGTLHGGQMLLGPLYVQLPAHAANLHVAASVGAGGIAISSLAYDDHDAMRVAGSLAFNRDGELDKLDLNRFVASFPAAYQRYGTSLVKSLTGFGPLDTSGSVSGSLDVRAGQLRAFDFVVHDVSVNSFGAGVAVAGLDGKVDWRAGASRPATRLVWDRLAVYRVALGPAALPLKDENGVLTLQQPVTAGVLDGSLQLNKFAWQPDAGTAQTLSAGLAITGVNLAELCKAFGWPAFGGELGGAVPDLRYDNGELMFGGGLSLDVFGGSVSVTNLSMRHLFGIAPELAADIDMRQLDLAQITSVFGFGKITGRLDGDIDNLELVAWKPTAFSANLTADGGGKISQHAIKSLTEVGGGGIAGGLQGMALRLFKTFGYSHIGISCTLASGVCAMGGITPDPHPDDDGYTIVQGSGLPHITVIGHQRQVDWATLVARLKAATEGQGPVVR